MADIKIYEDFILKYYKNDKKIQKGLNTSHKHLKMWITKELMYYEAQKESMKMTYLKYAELIKNKFELQFKSEINKMNQ
jgi:hypothetical protein